MWIDWGDLSQQKWRELVYFYSVLFALYNEKNNAMHDPSGQEFLSLVFSNKGENLVEKFERVDLEINGLFLFFFL